jgi:acetyltransferase-like isoleucine patch superfamily enzyme
MCLNGVDLGNKNNEHRPTSFIIIENNVYVGGNCTIYPGITIHHHSVIAPNSAVTKDVPPYTMVGGVPARFIKSIEI